MKMKLMTVGLTFLGSVLNVESAIGDVDCNDHLRVEAYQVHQRLMEAQLKLSDTSLDSSLRKIQDRYAEPQETASRLLAELDLSANKIDNLIGSAIKYLHEADREGPTSERHNHIVSILLPNILNQIQTRQEFLNDRIHEAQSLKNQIWAEGIP